MTLALETSRRASHPVDVFEQVASAYDWAYERSAEDEIDITVGGSWTDHHVSISWHEELESLHLACTFDIRAPETRREEIRRLVARINERLWLGHFDLWDQEGALMFRHGQLFTGGTEPTAEQCEAMLQTAIAACERYYPSFQLVLWGGMTAAQSIETALFETLGQA